MGPLSKSEVLEKFKISGRNSSHFVWLIAKLEYFESSNGIVFAYRTWKEIAYFALEPLLPPGTPRFESNHHSEFSKAVEEVVQFTKCHTAVFVGVPEDFLKNVLIPLKYQAIKVGEEPWVRLDNSIPRGNSGKGVRSARNRVLKAGIRVIELLPTDLEKKENRDRLEKIIHSWKRRHWISLSGFLNTVDVFSHSNLRRYFVALDPHHRILGLQAASPIPSLKKYFLEDLILSDRAPSGVGELLTLEAMVALNESGVEEASLGIISINSIEQNESYSLPPLVHTLVLKIPRIAKKLYSVDGLEIFRKRFKPIRRSSVYLALNKTPLNDGSIFWTWLKSLMGLLVVFSPKVQVSLYHGFRKLTRPIAKYQVSLSIAAISFALFAAINHFDEITPLALQHFGFTASAPLKEWLMRSVLSDLLYFDRYHFFFFGTFTFLILAWTEKTEKSRFLLYTYLFMSTCDDFINYLLLTLPFSYFHQSIFQHLTLNHDVGSSLLMMFFLGFQLCKFKRHRELIFVGLCVISVFSFVFHANKLTNLILNLNHFLFLSLGYAFGKLRFEQMRSRSRKIAKQKPPQSRTVASPFVRKKRNSEVTAQSDHRSSAVKPSRS